MPCPHNEISIVQRSQQQSAVAAAAYQSGEKLFCGYDQEVKHCYLSCSFCGSKRCIQLHRFMLLKVPYFLFPSAHCAVGKFF